MKKLFITCIMCFLLFILTTNVGSVFAFNEEILTFKHNNKVFTYTLSENIKHSSQFDLKYQLNKNNRFGDTKERQKLLAHLLNIGISKEIAIEYLFPNLLKTLNTINKNIYIKEKNACVTINTSIENVFNIKPEIIGKQLNTKLLIDTILNNYLNNSLEFEIPILETLPNITANNIRPYTYLRSDFSTSIASSSADRKHNIKNALHSLNKLEILPGEIFSFNKAVGRRTMENGYRTAKIIINNEYTDGLGGGVCQVSSTLYNSALLAGLEIVEANKHSKQISYVRQGFDAMVNFGSSDLKFKNNTNEKLTIITNFSNNNIRIRLFGQDLNHVIYKLTNEIFDIIEPTEEVLLDFEEKYTDKVLYDDEFFYLNTATIGKTIKSYREKYVNGTLVEKQLLRTDKFTPKNAIKVYGTKPRAKIMVSDSLEEYNLCNG